MRRFHPNTGAWNSAGFTQLGGWRLFYHFEVNEKGSSAFCPDELRSPQENKIYRLLFGPVVVNPREGSYFEGSILGSGSLKLGEFQGWVVYSYWEGQGWLTAVYAGLQSRAQPRIWTGPYASTERCGCAPEFLPPHI